MRNFFDFINVDELIPHLSFHTLLQLSQCNKYLYTKSRDSICFKQLIKKYHPRFRFRSDETFTITFRRFYIFSIALRRDYPNFVLAENEHPVDAYLKIWKRRKVGWNNYHECKDADRRYYQHLIPRIRKGRNHPGYEHPRLVIGPFGYPLL